MADTMIQIQRAHIDQFETNLRNEMQQKDSLLADKVEFGTMTGAKKRYTYIGAVSMSERTERMAATVWQDGKFDSRWASKRVFDSNFRLDKEFDIKKMLTDPTSDLLRNAVAAAKRKKDELIIGAFDGDVLVGENAGTTLKFDAANQEIGVQFGSNSNTGLTMDKLHEVRALIDEADVDPTYTQYIVVSPRILQNFLKNTEVKSADYNVIKALYEGTVHHFMGFEFVKSNQLPISSSVRSCFVWSKPAIQLAVSTEIEFNGPTPLAMFNWNPAFGITMAMDAVRLYDKAVFRIMCDESV